MGLEPYEVPLGDGETVATVWPVKNHTELPEDLVRFLCDEYNTEIRVGETLAYEEPIPLDKFLSTWFPDEANSVTGVMILGPRPQADEAAGMREWEKICFGTFYLKQHYPGRSRNIATGQFLVNPGLRSKGIGRSLVFCFASWALKLDFNAAVFDLVYETNRAAQKMLRSTGFEPIGRIPGAAKFPNRQIPVSALTFYRNLAVAIDPSRWEDARFERIRWFLQTGEYPQNIDRLEKARLRTSSRSYRLDGPRLMFNGREVLSDATQQVEVTTRMHSMAHTGVNKLTAELRERYHWSRMKETAAQVIRSCPHCRPQIARASPSTISGGGLDPDLPSATLDASVFDPLGGLPPGLALAGRTDTIPNE